MDIPLLGDDSASFSFGGRAKVSLQGDSNSSYLVKWFKESEGFVGEMALSTGQWGAYAVDEIEIWTVEFFSTTDGSKIASYTNELEKKYVLVAASSLLEGKTPNFERLTSYCSSMADKYKCDLKVYFKGSHLHDFSSLNFSPLRFNDNIREMFLGVEKTF